MTIANNIKSRRLELGMSQDDLATALGYKSRSTIAKIESGTNDIPLSKLLDLADALDVNVEYLLGGARRSTSSKPQTNAHNRSNRVGVIVLAGGRSTRSRRNIPNQFVNVLGKPIIIYVMEAYQNHPLIDDIYCVCADGWSSVVQAYSEQFGITKLKGITKPGPSGVQSAIRGLHLAEANGYSQKDVLILQESTRPLVSEETITILLTTCSKYGSAAVGAHMDDNVQFLTKGEEQEYIDRRRLVDLQSPDAYYLDRLLEIIRCAKEQAIDLNDSCIPLLMNKLGMQLHFCWSQRSNAKIIREEDILSFTALLKTKHWESIEISPEDKR